MGQVVKFKRRKRTVQMPTRHRWRLMPFNVLLPIFFGVGLLLNFADQGLITGPSPEEAQGPRVLRGGDALNGGRQGLSGSRSSQDTSPRASKRASTLIDRVTRVRDGDTIVVGLIPIRIANLDCAESGTPSGETATRRAKQLVSGATLTCFLEGRRSYDREVGVCSLPDGRDFGETMIAAGMCARW